MDILGELNTETNKLADELSTIRQSMVGKGISPAKSSVVEMKLQEVENKLRMIASRKDNIIPWLR